MSPTPWKGAPPKHTTSYWMFNIRSVGEEHPWSKARHITWQIFSEQFSDEKQHVTIQSIPHHALLSYRMTQSNPHHMTKHFSTDLPKERNSHHPKHTTSKLGMMRASKSLLFYDTFMTSLECYNDSFPPPSLVQVYISPALCEKLLGFGGQECAELPAVALSLGKAS